MQVKSPSTLKIPSLSPTNPIYKGVIALPRKPYHSVRSRSFSLTPYNQTNLISAQSSYTEGINVHQESPKMSSFSMIHIPNYYMNENDPNYQSFSPHELNKELFESKVEPFPDISDPNFDNDLRKKLEICSYIFDFSKDDQAEQREIKTETLEHFVSLFQDKSKVTLLNPFQQQAIFRVIDRNLFRHDPKFPSLGLVVDHLPPFSEPSWPHRSLCYQILNQFAILFPDAQYINIDIIKKVICHFQLPDPNERLQFVVFLKKYIDLHEKYHLIILTMLKDAMHFLKEDIYNTYCLIPLMAIFSHFILKYYDNLNDDIITVFFEAVMPLISYKYVSLSFQHVKNVFLLMIRTDKDLAYVTLKKLQKLWPHQNNSKQVIYTDLLISIASTLEHRAFEKLSLNFFSFLRDLLYTQRFKLIDTIVNIFINESYSSWITSNSIILINKLYEPIAILSISSSDKIIRNKCMNALRTMSGINNSEFNKCELIFKNKQKALENQFAKMNKNQSIQNNSNDNDNRNAKLIQYGIDNNFFFINNHDLKKEKRYRDIWLSIVNSASINNYSFTNEKQDEINRFFDQDKNDVLAISRFLPACLNHVEPVKKICNSSPKFLVPLMKSSQTKRRSMRASVPKCVFYSLAKSETNLHI